MRYSIKPASNRILVDKIEENDPIYQKPESKLIVIQDAPAPEDKVSDLLRVLAVGEDVKNYKVGDVVIKHNFQTGGFIIYAQKSYLLLSEADIICKIELEVKEAIN